MAGKHVLALSGYGEGQNGSIAFPETSVPTTFITWFGSISDAGVKGCNKVTEVAVTPTDPAVGANLDRKAVIHGKGVVTGKVVVTIPAYQAAEIQTHLTGKGEVIDRESGQDILNAWKVAAGYGAEVFTFTSGRVKQTL